VLARRESVAVNLECRGAPEHCPSAVAVPSRESDELVEDPRVLDSGALFVGSSFLLLEYSQ
jgi:hypothetical protein